jgi:hypothetical protein
MERRRRAIRERQVPIAHARNGVPPAPLHPIYDLLLKLLVFGDDLIDAVRYPVRVACAPMPTNTPIMIKAARHVTPFLMPWLYDSRQKCAISAGGQRINLERVMRLEAPLRVLQSEISPLERFVISFANSLGEPNLRHLDGDRGFRYEAPDVRHFCLLKSVRVVSALNASIALARSGYAQEIATVLRTMIECTTHIDFVLNPIVSEEHRSEVQKYIQAFFADSQRGPSAEIKRAQVPQGLVHASIGRTLDSFGDDTESRAPAAKLLSNVYRVFSNYVHAKYPEIMDLYGGRPGRFHLRGMSGTPKDAENLEIIRTCIVTAANAILSMVLHLHLRALVDSDPVLADWYRERFKQAANRRK